VADDYDVGYGKPPKHTRFTPGQSGNPNGRPKGTLNLKTDLLDELKERIVVREGERQRHVSKQRAMVKSVTARAIKGDARATAILVNLILRLLDTAAASETNAPLSSEEQAILEAFEQRVRQKTRPRRRSSPKAPRPNR
jgi:hypothetical protein